MMHRRTTGFDRPPGAPRPTLFNGGGQRSAISIPLPPLGTQGRILLVQCAVAAGEGAVATREYFEKGLSDLGRTQIPVNYPCEFGDRHAFSVSGGVKIVKPRLGDLIQARLVVHPDAVLLFKGFIDANDEMHLPSPFDGLVTAKWVDERKQSMRIVDIPEAAMLPEYVADKLRERGDKVFSCDWDVCPKSGLPRADAVKAVLKKVVGNELPMISLPVRDQL